MCSPGWRYYKALSDDQKVQICQLLAIVERMPPIIEGLQEERDKHIETIYQLRSEKQVLMHENERLLRTGRGGKTGDS